MRRSQWLAVTAVLATAVSLSAVNPASAASNTVHVDWNVNQRSVSRQAYGVNLYGGTADSISGQQTYRNGLKFLNPGLIRIHYQGIVNSSATDIRGWVDTGRRTWDAGKISRVFDNIQAVGLSTDILVTIPDFPSWMKTKQYTLGDKTVKLLDPSEWDNYAAFCADLVRILKNQGRNVRYISVTNEKDQDYYVEFREANQADHLDELIQIYNRAARAIKNVDGGIQVGGLEFARGDLYDAVRRFVRGASHLDFLSYHFYAVGDPYAANATVWNRTADLGRHTRDIRGILNQEGKGPVPLWNSEYNINWCGCRDWKQTLPEGAVFDALVFKESLDNGAVATAVWNDRDGYYGLMDNNENVNSFRIPGQVFVLANSHLTGTRTASTTYGSSDVVSFTVKSGSRRAIMVINRSESNHDVSFKFNGYWGNGQFSRYQIARPYTRTDSTVQFTNLGTGSNSVTLPPSSVTFFVGSS
jgi:xylan 1,4-beta-xylosidase